jgi:2-dehydropantoate 2-reductase
MERPPRILVIGIGGIGGTIAGWLNTHEAPVIGEVVALTRNQAVVDAINERGFVLDGVEGRQEVPGRAVTALEEDSEPFDWILLATQPPQVEQAAAQAAPFLAEGGRMVCFQNGLCEQRVAKVVGAERVVGGIVSWGASMVEPGVFVQTSHGGFTVGRLDSSDDPKLMQLALLLEVVGPVKLSDNLAGARWSKLAINCAISTLGTLGGDRLGVLMRLQMVRRLALELMTETVAVARAEGVRLEKVSGTLDLEWVALDDEERFIPGSAGLVAKHGLLLAVGTRFRRLRSSMLSAIERGRPPAVDFLNGEVVERGRALGVPVPVNEAARELVWAISRGERASSVETIRALWEQTAAVRGQQTE